MNMMDMARMEEAIDIAWFKCPWARFQVSYRRWV